MLTPKERTIYTKLWHLESKISKMPTTKKKRKLQLKWFTLYKDFAKIINKGMKNVN